MNEAQDFWFDCLIVDGPNFYKLLEACNGIPYLLGDLITQIEKKLETSIGRPVQFNDRIWVSPRLNPHRPNTRKLKRLFKQLQHRGWQIRLAPTHSSEEPDDELIKYLLWEKAETIPQEGSILALASGDGDFVETLRDIKSERSDLVIVVISGILKGSVAHKDLRNVADRFLDIVSLDCIRNNLGAPLAKSRVSAAQPISFSVSRKVASIKHAHFPHPGL